MSQINCISTLLVGNVCKNFKKDIDRGFSINHHALPSDNLYIDNTHNIYTEIVFLM